MSKTFSFIELKPNLLVERNYLDLFKEERLLSALNSFENLENYFEITFSHNKAYREIRAIKWKNKEIFLKKYLSNFEEAINEWKNINLLWERGFFTSHPLFFYQHPSFIIIATEKIEGHSFMDYLNLSQEKRLAFLERIAKHLALFHKTTFIHQDCYLNHFYWNEIKDKLYIIDVSRVKYKPPFLKYYQIKDLSQLKFSFYKYLKRDWKNFWLLFLKIYEETLGEKLSLWQRGLIFIKFKLIKRHTQKIEGIKY